MSIAGLLIWALANGLLVFSPGYVLMPSETKMGLAALPPLHLALAIIGALALCVGGALLSKAVIHELVALAGRAFPRRLCRLHLADVDLPARWRCGAGSRPRPARSVSQCSVVATTSPVLLYLIIQRIGFGDFLFERPDWARIAEDRPSKPAAGWVGVPAN